MISVFEQVQIRRRVDHHYHTITLQGSKEMLGPPIIPGEQNGITKSGGGQAGRAAPRVTSRYAGDKRGLTLASDVICTLGF